MSEPVTDKYNATATIEDGQIVPLKKSEAEAGPSLRDELESMTVAQLKEKYPEAKGGTKDELINSILKS